MSDLPRLAASTTTRLDALETENQELRAGLDRSRKQIAGLAVTAGVVALLAVYACFRQGPRPSTVETGLPSVIEAQGFVVKNAQGQARAWLGADSNGKPSLTFKGDEKGSLTVGFQNADRDFPYLSLVDREGRKRMSLGLGADEATIRLYDSAESAAVLISQHHDSGGSWSLAHRKDRAFVQSYFLDDGQARLEIADKDGEVVTGLPGPIAKQSR